MISPVLLIAATLMPQVLGIAVDLLPKRACGTAPDDDTEAAPTAAPSAPPSAAPSNTPSHGNTPSPASSGSSFKNIVFNSGVNDEPDIVGRFKNIQSYGITSWIGFTMSDPSPADPDLMASQIRICMTEDQISNGVNMVSGSNPPTYLQLLNEPDGGFYGQPIVSPQDAANALQPFFGVTTSTTYLSPAPAYPASSWLTDFFAACNGCESKIPIITAHIYSPDPNTAISLIQNVQSQFPDKKIWLTELSPAANEGMGCTLDAAGVQNWMTTVVGYAKSQSQIERVFWNCGEAAAGLGDGGSSCIVSLTNQDGSATDLLQTYGSM